jgi:hypothetical protein
MTFREENRNLFGVEHGYYFAHCISGDFALGAGVAKQFDLLYNMREKLVKKYGSINYNCVILVDNVFNLVTKDKYFQKPTYDSLIEALSELHDAVIGLEIEKLAMPRIGCGLDGLDWDKVKDIIQEMFADTNIEILVCYM